MNFLKALALTLPLIASSACAQSAPSDAQIEAFLMNNPEVLRDALDNLDAYEERQMIVRVKPQLIDNPNDATIGPKDAKVTIVEFFDYNCGYCKQSTAWVQEILEKHPDDVRVVFKELPLLDSRTGTSRNAAMAALAADRQGKYGDMHFKLMSESNLAVERVRTLAEEIGLDMEMFDQDMADDSLQDAIEEAYMLASLIPAISGTPFFVIGDNYVAGANVAKLGSLLDDALDG